MGNILNMNTLNCMEHDFLKRPLLTVFYCLTGFIFFAPIKSIAADSDTPPWEPLPPVTAQWWTDGAHTGEKSGAAVSTAGDINGDGFDDIIVGAYLRSDTHYEQGAASVYLGSQNGLSQTPSWEVLGEGSEEHFGRGVRDAGDVNGDGFGDIIIGAPHLSIDPNVPSTGYAHVYLGSAQGLSQAADWRAASRQFGDRLGRTVGSAGDINGDGFDDVFVGAYYHDINKTNEGGMALYLGSAEGLSRHHNWAYVSGNTEAGLGWSADTAGDVNGDGFDDMIAGAPFYDTQRNQITSQDGKAYAWLGSPEGLPETPSWTATIPERGSNYGRAVSTAGDVNGDGFDDVLVGARHYDGSPNGRGQGAAFLYYGSATGLSSTPDWIGYAEFGRSQFGTYLSSIGDLNQDGFDDFIIGAASAYRGEIDEGAVYVFLGSAKGPSSRHDLVLESQQAYAEIGYSIWRAGDVDGDGFPDIIAGAHDYDTPSKNAGRSFVYSGAKLNERLRKIKQSEADQLEGIELGLKINQQTFQSSVFLDEKEALEVSLHVASQKNPNAVAEWWLVGKSSQGTFWYQAGTGWVASTEPVLAGQAAINELAALPVLYESAILPSGLFQFTFGLDLKLNGKIDTDAKMLRYEKVNVYIGCMNWPIGCY